MPTELKPSPLAVLVVLLLLVPSVLAADEDVVAEIGGQPVSLAELEASIAGELARVETERHRVLAAGLERLVANRLIEMEAASRELTVEAFLAEAASPEPVSDADVDLFYTQNAARLRQPKDALAGQIRAHLENQRRAEAQNRLIAELAAKHGVEKRLEPLRFAIDTAGAPAKGGEEAAVTLVEYSDFQCPGCAGIQTVLDQVLERYGDKLRLVFKQFPLHSIHPEAQKAAEAALCAGDQDEFWAMHDALFAQQSTLDAAFYADKARDLGLDGEKFDACLKSGEKAGIAEADQRQGQEIGVASTPSLFINGRPVAFVNGVSPFETLSSMIEEELGRAVR